MFLRLIKTKVLCAVAACFLLCIALAAVIAQRSWSRDLDRISQQALRTSREGFSNLQKNDVKMLSAALEPLLSDPVFIEPFAKRDFETLRDRCTPLYSDLKARYGITHWYFIEPDGTCFLRVHKPETRGDLIKRATFIASQKSGGFGTGLELGKTAFALRVVHPMADASGAVSGYMELGEEIDHFLAILKGQTGSDYGLLVKKQYLNEKDWGSVRAAEGRPDNWAELKDSVLIGATTGDETLAAFQGSLDSVPDEGLSIGLVHKGGKSYYRGVIPVKDVTGAKVGGLFVLEDVTSVYEGIKADRRNMALLLGGAMVILAVLLMVLLNALVFRRLDRVIDVTVRFVGGDHETAIRHTSDDEVGRLEELLEQLRVVFLDTVRLVSGRKD